MLFTLCCAVVVAAAGLPAQTTRMRITLPGFREPFSIEDVSSPFELAAPAGKSYPAVKAALAELKVQLSVDDSAGGLLGNTKLVGMGSFLGYRLSRLLDCGDGATGPVADSYRLAIVFLVLLDPIDGARTKMRVGFIAGGQDISGTSKIAVTCGSRGTIEEKLFQLTAKRLQ